jgi:hypothetical protein
VAHHGVDLRQRPGGRAGRLGQTAEDEREPGADEDERAEVDELVALGEQGADEHGTGRGRGQAGRRAAEQADDEHDREEDAGGAERALRVGQLRDGRGEHEAGEHEAHRPRGRQGPHPRFEPPAHTFSVAAATFRADSAQTRP